jgi:hypothetical protein
VTDICLDSTYHTYEIFFSIFSVEFAYIVEKWLLLTIFQCFLQESSNKQTKKQKGGGKAKGQHSFPGKNRQNKNKCKLIFNVLLPRNYFILYYLDDKKCSMIFDIGEQKWRNFDEDDCIETPYGAFGGKRSFTWYWPGEDSDGSFPSGFQWRHESQSTKSREKFWNESDVDEEEKSVHDNLQSHRFSLGLPPLGPLNLDQIKSA